MTRPSESHRNMKWLYEQVNAGNPVVVMMSLDTFQFQHSSPFSLRPIDVAIPVRSGQSSFTFAGVVTVSYTHLTLPTILNQCRSRWSPYH